MNKDKNLLDLVRMILKWKWPIVILTVVGAIVSVIYALMLPNYYKSSAVFHPYNLSTFDRIILFNTESSDRVLNYFGDKHDVSRVLQIANSGPMIEDVIRHYNLAEHYDIDTTKAEWRHDLQLEFKDNYAPIKTEEGSIEITIWDTDPVKAAEMVNYVVSKIDKGYLEPIVSKNAKTLSTIEQRYKIRVKELQALTDNISAIKDTNRIEYKVVRSKHSQALSDVNDLETLIWQYKATAEQSFETLIWFERPMPAEKKDRPMRSIIVLATTVGMFFLALLFAILVEQYKSLKLELQNTAA